MSWIIGEYCIRCNKWFSFMMGEKAYEDAVKEIGSISNYGFICHGCSGDNR